MLDKCESRLAGVLCNHHIIREEDKEIIVYGLDALLSTLINLILIIGLGLFLGLFAQTVVFLLSFAILRIFAGGYHARTRIACTASFILIYLTAMALQHYTPDTVIKPLAISLAVIALVSVFLLAPVEHKNRPYQGKEYNQFKIISRIISGLQTLLVIAGTIFVGYDNLAYCISLAMLGVTIILVIARRLE